MHGNMPPIEISLILALNKPIVFVTDGVLYSRLKATYSTRNGTPKRAEEPYLRPFVS